MDDQQIGIRTRFTILVQAATSREGRTDMWSGSLRQGRGSEDGNDASQKKEDLANSQPILSRWDSRGEGVYQQNIERDVASAHEDRDTRPLSLDSLYDHYSL
ncbi:hypothetical protein NEOLEDRAFT_1134436 [Neolentinus lepideus HHB14362 ss-1]|uniref:Uncharacterized protein n=1 Tax=Neolentinus lepideus HHB14362 ss-1 TaxID=1314782 RepID=A0A165S866_9AGAM|nr:hypothetical protein NEOLEDRAFT_1134436 [Neolentinus lepideus HHB14362 ss-1]